MTEHNTDLMLIPVLTRTCCHSCETVAQLHDTAELGRFLLAQKAGKVQLRPPRVHLHRCHLAPVLAAGQEEMNRGAAHDLVLRTSYSVSSNHSGGGAPTREHQHIFANSEMCFQIALTTPVSKITKSASDLRTENENVAPQSTLFSLNRRFCSSGRTNIAFFRENSVNYTPPAASRRKKASLRCQTLTTTMPELPEVEKFRQILLPLTAAVTKSKVNSSSSSSACTITIECPSPTPPKVFPSQNDIDAINRGGYAVGDVLRKGKVLCIVLKKQTQSAAAERATKRRRTNGDTDSCNITGNEPTIYLSLHMGMTGRISSPGNVPSLESLSECDEYPPPHTHMIIKSTESEACFSDPRRFGSASVFGVWCEGGDLIPSFKDLAPDALESSAGYSCANDVSKMGRKIAEQLSNQRRGIKAVLLDQRAVVSGVGNWVADEILYRSKLHPDQSFLNVQESQRVVGE
eukprot:scaffold785_cov216-Alexandrium_tamarense.AAC.3